MRFRLVTRGALGAGAVAALALVAAAGSANADPGPDSPAQVAVPTDGKQAVPRADIAKIAKDNGASQDQVLAQEAQLQPIVQALAPSLGLPTAQPKLSVATAGEATPDECFQAIGQGGPPVNSDGTCPDGYTTKYNSSYVYGSAVTPDSVYFGTLTNPVCGATAAYLPKLEPFVTEDTVCEGAGGPNGRELGWTVYGDFAKQFVKRLDVATNQIVDVTPTAEQAPKLRYSTGLRGGGYKDDVVLLANSILNESGTAYGGLEMLAYRASTGEFLGEHVFSEYFNMRNGQLINGELYFGARLAGTGAGAGGAIIKWVGSADNPFAFETVASGLKSEPAYLVEHDGRMVVSGWTVIGKFAPENAMAEIYLGPKIPKTGGLTAETSDPSNWGVLFKMSDFEPDPVLARVQNFGDIASFDGKLVFSTYSYAGYATANAFHYYGRPDSEVGRLSTFVNSERAINILQMSNVGKKSQKTELLYGNALLPVYNQQTGLWVPQANNLHQAGKFGLAGFGNRYNYYSWMWVQYKGSLYMSTFDASSMIQGLTEPLNPALLELSPTTLALLQPVSDTIHAAYGGADVWRFDKIKRPAVAETLDGFGDPNRHGVRAWAAFPEQDKLFAGMTSWRNLKEGWKMNVLTG